MKFIEGPSKGTEAIYVEGSYDNKLLARQEGICECMTFSLDPRGLLATYPKRHPVTELGFGFLLDEFRRNFEPAVRSGELEITRLAMRHSRGDLRPWSKADSCQKEGRNTIAPDLLCTSIKNCSFP